MPICIVISVTVDEETPEAAYRTLSNVMGASPFSTTWMSTDEWFDGDGEPLEGVDIDKARSAIFQEREKGFIT